uniref:Uncharacterized protein n=1 Tax=Aegilops tauschii TaxID=37682 RepID=M8BUP1_AEGTA
MVHLEAQVATGAAAPFAAGGATEGEYDKVLGQLSSLTQKVRAHTGNPGIQWDLMDHYLQLEEAIAWMKVIHVIVTKGKPLATGAAGRRWSRSRPPRNAATGLDRKCDTNN